jgi:glycyl-tRNA synthetase beta chain
MGGYYARHDGEDARVAGAVRDHYQPRGLSDPPPSEPIAIAVALADKLDQLASFFSIGERPSGSGDPYALRRAALGVIRIILENEIRVSLRELVNAATANLPASANNHGVTDFIIERLRVQLRADGARHDVLDAMFSVSKDDDLTRLISETRQLSQVLVTPEGQSLLRLYRRANNILLIEEKRDGRSYEASELAPDLLATTEERELLEGAKRADSDNLVGGEGFAFTTKLQNISALRAPMDRFFDAVLVNDPNPAVRANRLCLLRWVVRTVDRFADFSKVESRDTEKE